MNWSTVMKNGLTLKTGDVVSVSGLGRLKVKALPYSCGANSNCHCHFVKGLSYFQCCYHEYPYKI